MSSNKAWQEARDYSPIQLQLAREILEEIREGEKVNKATRNHPQPGGGFIGKHILVHVYRELTDSGEWPLDPNLVRQIRMKPSRTLSGVTTVTVLTKPYPCPGKCIFCPTDARMPKSYLPDEPGAMRALHHEFEPYEQTIARIEALESIGHPTDKIELLILGGTWSSYKGDYQEWFLQRCFDAMNEVNSDSLEAAQQTNESAKHKNVGLVIETRPDWIDKEEVVRLRKLGVTKVQLGAQSFDDKILKLNNRGHGVEETRAAIALLRAGGFKIVLHWMPNLLGATLDSDRLDFMQLWDDPGIRPDEIKIYPCQLLENAELYEYWSRGEYTPYTTDELIDLIADLKVEIPRYCRVNRVVRDIPSNNVVEGNRRTSLRQDIQNEIARRGLVCSCIRCREVKELAIDLKDLKMSISSYSTLSAEEYFLSFQTGEDRIAGYLRLSLPNPSSPDLELADIEGAALIREVHVYGQSLLVGEEQAGAAQHSGLGTRLMEKAEEISREKGIGSLAVISALGTRGYYRGRGYRLGESYMVKKL
jgi:elongator complex protein 3